VRHLARNEDKVVADDRRHKAGGWRRGNADGWILWISYPASGTTAISDVDIVASAAKQRSMTTEVLGGM
jgi:methyl coenzyme M reductase beta subunit